MLGALKEKDYYTFEEFDRMNQESDEWLEFIEGKIYALASPSTNHQRISRKLTRMLDLYFDGKECELFPAPFDIKLTKEHLDSCVVIPDLTVICDKSGLTDKRYEGVPAFVIEILSPSNQHHDLIIKMNLYAQFGIKEYWIINPLNQSVSTYKLDESGHYIQDVVATKNGVIYSSVFPDLAVDLEMLFKF